MESSAGGGVKQSRCFFRCQLVAGKKAKRLEGDASVKPSNLLFYFVNCGLTKKMLIKQAKTLKTRFSKQTSNLFLPTATKATSCSFARQDLYRTLSSLLTLKFASASYILLPKKKESQVVPFVF